MSKENTENLKIPEQPKVSYLKGTYIWKQTSEESYECKMKIIKSINNNIKLPISYTYINDIEYILKPRSIVNDPFSSENSLLIWCDLVTFEGKSNNLDDRINFLQELSKHQEVLKEKIPKISFVQNFTVNTEGIDIENLLEDFIRLCLGSNIEIDEYSFKGNKIKFNTVLNQVLSACDELLLSRYLFNRLSKKYKFNYDLDDNLSYIFCDIKCTEEDGQKNLLEYVNNLKNNHKTIDNKLLDKNYINKTFSSGNNVNDMILTPDSSLKLKSNHLIDQRFKSSSDVYSIICQNIKVIYNLK